MQHREESPIKCVWLCGLVALLLGLVACSQSLERAAARLTGGDPEKGKEMIRKAVDHLTVMPNLVIKEVESRHISIYIYTLKYPERKYK
jgi:hypothetical protein